MAIQYWTLQNIQARNYWWPHFSPPYVFCTAQNSESHSLSFVNIAQKYNHTKIKWFNPLNVFFLNYLFYINIKKSSFFLTDSSCLKLSPFNYDKFAAMV